MRRPPVCVPLILGIFWAAVAVGIIVIARATT